MRFHTNSSPRISFRVRVDYREAGGVSVFQKGLKNHGEIVPEEPVTEQQQLKPLLWNKAQYQCILYLTQQQFLPQGY